MALRFWGKTEAAASRSALDFGLISKSPPHEREDA